MDDLTLLLVDDNPTFYRIMEQFVTGKSGFGELLWAQDGASAIKAATEHSPDVILLDLGMPDVSGLEILPILHSLKPDAIIIVVTLLDTESYRKASLQLGADDFVAKSKLNLDLLPAIEKALSTKGPFVEAA